MASEGIIRDACLDITGTVIMSTEQQFRLQPKVIMLAIIPVLTMTAGLTIYLAISSFWNITQNNTTIALVTVLTLAFSLVIAWVMYRRILPPLDQLENTLNQLPIKPPSHDNISDTASTIAQEPSQAKQQPHSKMDQNRSTPMHIQKTIDNQNSEPDLTRKQMQNINNNIESDFLTQLSHEIRTPMNGIVGFTNLLKKTGLTPEQNEYTEMILQSSSGLLNLINGILSFSNFEAGHIRIIKKPFKIRECCEERIIQYTQIAHSKQIELILLIYDDVPNNLHGDPSCIKQLLSTLIDSALKYTHEGEVVVRVMLEEETDAACTLQISVTDTDTGIIKSAQQNLSTPSNQENSLSIHDHDGLGLGLGLGISICHQLIQSLNGSISIDSTPGSGSCYRVTLTLDKALNQPTEPFPDVLQGKNIALLEAHQISRACLRSQLEHLNTNTQLYENIEQLLTTNIDNIDLIVAGFSSDEFYSRYAKQTVATLHSKLSKPILALLSISENPSLQSIQEAGATQCHTKPLTLTMLSNILTSIFAPEAAHHHSNNAQQFSDHHFLVVDDDPMNQELVAALLEESSVHITHAHNGHEAIALAAKNHYSLILMDIHMPGINGIEATKIIRDQESPDQRVPIIALTASIEARLRKQALLAGMDDYIAKPFNESQLWSAIERLFSRPPYAISKNNPQLKTSTFSNHPAKEPGEVLTPAHVAITPINTNQSEPALTIRNIEHALSVAGGSKTLADKMFSALQIELPQQLDAMQKQAADNNWDELWNITHRIHGSTAICGVPALNQAVADLEQAIKTGTAEEKHHNLKQVANEIDRVLHCEHT